MTRPHRTQDHLGDPAVLLLGHTKQDHLAGHDDRHEEDDDTQEPDDLIGLGTAPSRPEGEGEVVASGQTIGLKPDGLPILI